MIDIPLLVVVGRRVASIARRKQREPHRYVGFLLLAWYGGALLGGYAAGVIDKAAGIGASKKVPPIPLIAGAITGAFTGLLAVYLWVRSLPPAGADAEEFADYDDRGPGPSP